MKGNVQLFNFENQQLRTLKINDEPYFVGKDLASILGYSNTRDALNRHVELEDQKILTSQNTTLENIPNRGLTVVNESGMYSLILSSKLPNAKKFKHWVTSEVLPAIRKTGSYQLPQTPEERLKLTIEATIHLDERMTNVEKDVDFIKNTSEIDSNQRFKLRKARDRKSVEVCGGKKSNFYKDKNKRRKVFRQLEHDFKDSFVISRYEDLSKKDFDRALNFITNWYPSYPLQQDIQQMNAQTDLGL
ncbi:ORF6C domain-containing protein [Lactobacillus hominis]|uniref:Toxin-antitoxin system, toxin component, Bro family n=1 Tax=Lactobacillus hominis DSM 23910 = CRBIP 24.179 TaxID=1423758 RepID=I7IW01_9LACO|nr:ORF6C domain-containing protein [Lactobacillus hominis]KRM84229.1 toxin-antitoxin system, toxin component, Bro family [Lactobacillus hominis DSM 23910 = CRBIP 24.179]MCT3348204.1 toxin Bro [Lactobacillus hominis]CCI82333.1 Toxin-antitoxin system, toxin component, Bro family [Lactobacillus hominis DSM 23910 = CRBIP 24.179]